MENESEILKKLMCRCKLLLSLVCAIMLINLLACDRNPARKSANNTSVENNKDYEEPVKYNRDNSEVLKTSTDNEYIEESVDQEETEDFIRNNSDTVYIRLNGSSVSVNSAKATVQGCRVTITSAGTYSISGSMDDGQIIVDTEDDKIVRLILDKVDISSFEGAPIYIANADTTLIVLADNTDNYIADRAPDSDEGSGEEEANAAIFSKSDLAIRGNGSLSVDGKYNDGIASRDGLLIAGGVITVNSKDDGIRGKDYLIIKDGNITVNAGGDGLKSDNDEDASKGYIIIESGVVDITSGGDAIQAATNLLISYGEISIQSGGGSKSRIYEGTSAKGIKAVQSICIDDGTMKINSADDAIHSNKSLTVNGGAFFISTADDGMHADSVLEINGGDLYITESYEGIESAIIRISRGNIHITSSDDGLNCAGGRDGSGMGRPGGQGGMRRPGGPGWAGDRFAFPGNYFLYINGGYIAINANGDGIDVNGSIEMSDGCVIIHGPTSDFNSALDYNASFKISGGFLLGAGSLRMAQVPDRSSTQNSVLLTFGARQRAGTPLHIQTSGGNEIFSFLPAKDYQSIAFSSPELINGSGYNVFSGGSLTGKGSDGLYLDGTYTPGNQVSSFTVTNISAQVHIR